MSDDLHHRPLRFELKYLLPLNKGEELWDMISPYCVTDQYADPRLGYEVASLYYDTVNQRFREDREESTGYRRKVRLRAYLESSYLESSDGQLTSLKRHNGIYMEIKEKHKYRVAKKRCKLSDDTFLDQHTNDVNISIDSLVSYLPSNHVATREVLYLHTYLGLRPTALIRYIRRSFMGKFEPGLRITIDYRVTVGGTSLLSYQPEYEKFVLAPSMAVLEIKSFGTIPIWLQNALLKFELSRTRMSKYCEGLNRQDGRPLLIKPYAETGVYLQETGKDEINDNELSIVSDVPVTKQSEKKLNSNSVLSNSNVSNSSVSNSSVSDRKVENL
jgi:hypothetical protein